MEQTDTRHIYRIQSVDGVYQVQVYLPESDAYQAGWRGVHEFESYQHARRWYESQKTQ